MKLKDLIENKPVIVEYNSSNLKNIISEDLFRGSNFQIQTMLLEASTLYSNYNEQQLLQEFGMADVKSAFKMVGKKAAKPFIATAKVYSKITKPINDFVEKYAYEKTKLKDFDEKIYEETKQKFDSFLSKLNPDVADKIRKTIKKAQTIAKDNPIKLGLLTMAMLSAMSFAGSGMIPILIASVLTRGMIGLLKGEKPIKAFGKTVMYSAIGKTIGWLGSEFWEWAQESLFDDKEIEVMSRSFSTDSENVLDDKIKFSDLEDIGKEMRVVKGKIENWTFNYKDDSSEIEKLKDWAEYLKKEIKSNKELFGGTNVDDEFVKKLNDDLNDILPKLNSPDVFMKHTGIDPTKPTTFREVIKQIYTKQGNLSYDEIDAMIDDKFPKDKILKNKYFGELDIDKPIKQIGFSDNPRFTAAYDPVDQTMEFNFDLVNEPKKLLRILGHESLHGSDMEMASDSKFINFRHFTPDTDHQSLAQDASGFIQNYVGSVGELQARLREVQQASIEAFGKSGIMKSGDVESGKKFLKWFLFSKDTPEIANEFGGVVPSEEYTDTIAELKAYIKHMKSKGFNTKQIFDVFSERATELAKVDSPISSMDNITMVAENYKLLAKQYFIKRSN